MSSVHSSEGMKIPFFHRVVTPMKILLYICSCWLFLFSFFYKAAGFRYYSTWLPWSDKKKNKGQV